MLLRNLQTDQSLQGNRPDTDKLHLLYDQYCNRQDFISQLLTGLAEPQTQITASWLLKHYLQQQVLDTQQTMDLLNQLQGIESWQARLQLLQCVQFLKIPSSAKPPLEQYVRENLADSNTFVRAWSYDAFFRLAVQFSEYRPEAHQLLQMGLRDEPASVKARIRRLVAEVV